LWLFVVCGVVIIRVRGIGLICAGRDVGVVIGVNGGGVGRFVVVGGYADVVQCGGCSAGGSLYICGTVGGIFLVSGSEVERTHRRMGR
jgi:hypothetical protein